MFFFSFQINGFEYKEAEDKEMFLTELLSNNVDCFKKNIKTKIK